MESEGTNCSSSSFFPERLFSAVPFLPYMHSGENNVPLSCAFTKAFPILSVFLEGAHVTNPSPSPALTSLESGSAQPLAQCSCECAGQQHQHLLPQLWPHMMEETAESRSQAQRPVHTQPRCFPGWQIYLHGCRLVLDTQTPTCKLKFRGSIPSTGTARLEPLQSAAPTSLWQLWLFEHRQHHLGTARDKLNTVGVKCSISWLIQHGYHSLNLSECGIITQSVGRFCTPPEAFSTAFYSCGVEFTYPCTPKWVPYLLCSKQRLEGLVLSI